MKYLLFSTLIAAQMWIAGFEARLNDQMGSHYGTPPGYHYAEPINLIEDRAAVAVMPQVEPYLVATEAEALVDSIASYLPPTPPGPPEN